MPRRDHVNPLTRKDYTGGFKMHDDQISWVTTQAHQIILAVREEKDGYLPSIGIMAPPKLNGGKGWHISLTTYTEAEFLAVKELFDKAFELALPLVQDRDRRAKEQLDNGDDSNERVYRPLPTVVKRPRLIGLDAESVLERLSATPPLGEQDGDPAAPAGDDGGDVAERYEA